MRYEQTPGEHHDGRSGRPFTLRLRDAHRAQLMAMMAESNALPWGSSGRMPRVHGEHYNALGSWLVWAALQWRPPAPADAGKTIPRPRKRLTVRRRKVRPHVDAGPSKTK